MELASFSFKSSYGQIGSVLNVIIQFDRGD